MKYPSFPFLLLFPFTWQTTTISSLYLREFHHNLRRLLSVFFLREFVPELFAQYAIDWFALILDLMTCPRFFLFLIFFNISIISMFVYWIFIRHRMSNKLLDIGINGAFFFILFCVNLLLRLCDLNVAPTKVRYSIAIVIICSFSCEQKMIKRLYAGCWRKKSIIIIGYRYLIPESHLTE